MLFGKEDHTSRERAYIFSKKMKKDIERSV